MSRLNLQRLRVALWPHLFLDFLSYNHFVILKALQIYYTFSEVPKTFAKKNCLYAATGTSNQRGITKSQSRDHKQYV